MMTKNSLTRLIDLAIAIQQIPAPTFHEAERARFVQACFMEQGLADVGLDTNLVSVYLFADGTITIYSSEGIHSTGLRGASKVAAAATTIFEEVDAALGEFSPVEDVSTLPLPNRGESQILARTYEGDFAASGRLRSKHQVVAELAAMALLLTQLARMALVEGFDRVEAGDGLVIRCLEPGGGEVGALADERGEEEYERRTEGVGVEQAAAIAVEISRDRREEENHLPEALGTAIESGNANGPESSTTPVNRKGTEQ